MIVKDASRFFCGISLVAFVGFSHIANAQDLSAFSDCAVLEAKTTYHVSGAGGGSRTGTVQIVPGFGSAFSNQFHASPLPPGHQNTKDFVCKHRNTRPVTNAQVSAALSTHLEQINSSIKANTVEVQQSVAQSFAIQIDILITEVVEIRSLLSTVDEQDVAVIGARLDSLEARLDALTQIANN